MSDRSEDRTTHGRVSVGDILRSSDELTPPDVKASMRARVLASVVSEPSRIRAGRTYVVAATLVTVVLLCTAGVGIASSRSLPGGTFYPVKRALEQVRVIIAPAEGQADVYVDIADERIREVERLLNTGASARALNQAVDGFADAARGSGRRRGGRGCRPEAGRRDSPTRGRGAPGGEGGHRVRSQRYPAGAEHSS
jgi:hypothetical protein